MVSQSYGRRFVALGRPPRSLSWTVKIRFLFGGWAAALWVVFAFVTSCTGNAVLDSEIMERYEFRGPLAKTEGQVTASEEIKVQQSDDGPPKASGELEIRYTYEVGGRRFEGTSYTRDRELQEGAKVDVEYVTDGPATSRIQGTRRRRNDAWLPMTGAGICVVLLVVLLASVTAAIGKLRVLRDGELVYARLMDKQGTGGSVNGARVHRYVFAAELPPPEAASYRVASGGSQWERIEHNTHEGHALQDEFEEPALVDRRRPGRGILLDAYRLVPAADGSITTSGGNIVFALVPAFAAWTIANTLIRIVTAFL